MKFTATVADATVARDEKDPNVFEVTWNGVRYRLSLLPSEIKAQGFDKALFEAVELVKAGKRGTRL